MGIGSTVAEVGIGVAVVIIAAKALQGIKAPSASDIANSLGVPLPSTIPNPIGAAGSQGAPPDYVLNSSIDNWFDGASGFFGTGLGSYDPTDWTAFARNGWLYQTYTLPASPTPYFQSKVDSWNRAHGLTF